MMRNDNRTPELPLSVQGASPRPALLRYETMLVNLTDPSRPSRISLNVSGNISLAPGQRDIEPVRLNVNWSFIPYNAEYHVSLVLTPLHNALAANQSDAVALFVFGTPPGHCPPGTATSSGGGGALKDLAPYANSAPLQDMHLNLYNASGGVVAKELDPPFEPLEPRYLLRIPFGTARSELDLGSTRAGDLVQLDAQGCEALSSQSWLVEVPRRKNLWRAAVDLSAQRSPCNLTVNVLVYQDDAAAAGGAAGDAAAAAASSVKSLAAGNGTNLTVLVPAAAAAAGSSSSSGGGNSSSPLPGGVSSSSSSSSSPPVGEGNATSASPASLARINVALRAANSTVASNVTAAALNSTIYSADAANSSSSSSSSSSGGGSTWAPPPGSAAASAANRTLVLYKSYTLQLVPMTDPQQLQLRAISFRNKTHIVVACGQPSDVVNNSGGSSSDGSSSSGSGGGGSSSGDGGQVVKSSAAVLSAADGNDPEGEELQQQQQRQAAAPDTRAGTNSSITTVAAVGNTTLVLQRTVVWYSRQEQALCDPNAYILVPFADVSASMALQPELQFPNASGVALDVSGQYVLRQAAAPPAPAPAAGQAPPAPAAVGAARAQPGAGGANDSALAALPEGCVELPVVVKLDGGLSSRTFTMLLYSNSSSVSNLSSTSISTRQATGEAPASAADLQELVFGGRPPSWPRSPAQNSSCAICPHGTFSSKLDSASCQACPPGKYARSPLASLCEPCPAGAFAFSWGSFFCRCGAADAAAADVDAC
jgi:hypothetical protein